MRLFFMLSALCPLLVACSGASTPQKTTGLTPPPVSPEEPQDVGAYSQQQDAFAENATPSTGGAPAPTDLREDWTLEVVAQSPTFASVHRVVRKGDAVILNGVALSAAEGRALEQHLDAIDWDGQPDTPPAAIGGGVKCRGGCAFQRACWQPWDPTAVLLKCPRCATRPVSGYWFLARVLDLYSGL